MAVGVGVGVSVSVAVPVGVSEAVDVSVGVSVIVGVWDGVGVLVGGRGVLVSVGSMTNRVCVGAGVAVAALRTRVFTLTRISPTQ